MESVFHVDSYRTAGVSDDEAIRACLADAKKVSERTIVFSGADYLISEAILLAENTTVLVDGCTIKQADETFDNVFRGDNLVLNEKDPFGTPIECKKIKNLKILGKNGAKIEGPDKNREGYHTELKETQLMIGDFWGWRTFQICFSMCDGFEVGGLIFEKSRCWTMSFDICQHGYIHDLKISTNVKNGDGVDFRSGCHHCVVENLEAMTSDDAVACTALTKAKRIYPDETSMYTLEPTRYMETRTKEEKDISDIKIRNLKVGGMHHGVICLAANTCQVHDVSIENVEEIPSVWKDPYREATVKLYTGYGAEYAAGDLHDITVKNVRGLYASNTVYSNADVKNVTLSGITHANPETDAVKLKFPDGFRVLTNE